MLDKIVNILEEIYIRITTLFLVLLIMFVAGVILMYLLSVIYL